MLDPSGINESRYETFDMGSAWLPKARMRSFSVDFSQKMGLSYLIQIKYLT
jgi:hypothetical protein